MSELYLIAHKVRNEAAFDVALQMDCPHCHGKSNEGREPYVCFDCEDLGFWWIIPTSGHRAFPYWSLPLDALMHDTAESFPLIDPERTLDIVPVMPPDWPDHYKVNGAPKLDITTLFNASREAKPHIARRL